MIAHSVRVRVNDDLILDVGTSEVDSKGNDVLRVPKLTLFRQLLVYLKNKPEPIRPGAGSYASRDGVAATAMVRSQPPSHWSMNVEKSSICFAATPSSPPVHSPKAWSPFIVRRCAGKVRIV